MAASRDDLSRWFDEGVRQGATHMVVVCDTFDWEDFPVYVMPGDVAEDVVRQRSNPNQMSRVMEVYNLSMSKAEQMQTARVFNY
jgi:hypothetical protein